MADAITDKTKLVFLCNPNNPTGTSYGKAAFDAFLGRVPDDVPIVVDEAYFEYVTAEDYPDGLDYFDADGRIVVLRTFSKIYSLAGAADRLRRRAHRARARHRPGPRAVQRELRGPGRRVLLAGRRGRGRAPPAREPRTEDLPVFVLRPARHRLRAVGDELRLRQDGEAGRSVRGPAWPRASSSATSARRPALRVGVGTPEEVEATCAAFEAVVAKLGQL